MRPSGSVADAMYVDLTSNVTVGLIARFARTEPAPRSNGVAGVTPSSFSTFCTDEVINADLIWPGVQLGCAAFSSAATPAECGLDIDVPAIAW